MKIQSERGWIILAQNNDRDDYLSCARALARSLRLCQTRYPVCLLTDIMPDDASDFDHVQIFPFGDQARDSQWKLQNDWQVFYASPYRQTIKLESDLWIPRNIDHWFDACQGRDLVTMLGTRNLHGQWATSRKYRQIFDDNGLPDVYNAIVYWRLCRESKAFFDTVRDIFGNWQSYMSVLKRAIDQTPNTDLAYALALRMLGDDIYTWPGSPLTMVHLKPAINGLVGEDWTQEVIWELDGCNLRLNTIQQMYPVHYQIKRWANVTK